MGPLLESSKQLEDQGFTRLSQVFSQNDIIELSNKIETYIRTNLNEPNQTFFAIRHLFIQIPELKNLIITPGFKKLIQEYAGKGYFITKAIYFSKPKEQNWFVSYHQDISVNVEEYNPVEEYSNWVKRDKGYSVSPDSQILENTLTFRIHLDSCDGNSGALKVLCGTHSLGVRKIDSIRNQDFTEEICDAESGDVLLMRPLLFHSSSRTTKPNRRRIIHIELCNLKLKDDLRWLEKINI